MHLSQPVGLCEGFWKLPPELSLNYLCYAAWLGIQVDPEACTQALLRVPLHLLLQVLMRGLETCGNVCLCLSLSVLQGLM